MNEQPTPCMSIYEYGSFKLNEKGEIICLIDELMMPPIHIKEYYGNESEGRCADKRSVLHLLNELADKNPNLHKEEYLRGLLFKAHFREESLEKENEELKKRLENVLSELYCKDRKLEELNVDIECCDKND